MIAWTKVTISDVANEVTVGHVGPMASEYVDKGIPFLRSLNIEPFNIKYDGVKFITPSFHKRLQKSSLRPGDVVIVRTGKPGTCAVIPDWLLEANCSDVVIVRCSERVRPRFLCYVVNSVAGHHISSHIVGAVQQHFNVGSARTLQFLLPSIEGQDAILAILGALDDKIDLNRRTNETLEAMARALFRNWFVDFGPTRAKMAGQTPYLAPEVWELFPDRLDDEGKPEGWTDSLVGQQFHVTMGQSPPGDTYNSDGIGIPFYQGKTDFGTVFPKRRMYCTAPTRFANTLDSLVSVRAPVGDVNLSEEKCCIGRGLASVRHPQNLPYYTYFTMKFLRDVFSSFENNGTVFGSINKKQFEELFVIESGVEKIFEGQVMPTCSKIVSNETESCNLTQLRDLLLPKLMSGEIRIRDAEKMVEDAL